MACVNLVDFDQVLFNTRDALQLVYTEAFAVNGINVVPDDITANEGNCIDILFDKYDVDAQLRDKIRIYKEHHYPLFFKFIIPNYDILELGNKVIVSNAHTRDIERILDYFGISDVLGVIGRDKVEHRKPEPDPYIAAITLFPSDEYAVFEDSNAGIKSANAAVQLLGLEGKVTINVVETDTVKLNGGSGQLIRRQGNVVDKVTTVNDSLTMLYDNGIPTPRVIFKNNEKIIMEFLEGQPLCDVYSHDLHFKKVIELIENIRSINHKNRCNVGSYIDRLRQHKQVFEFDEELTTVFDNCMRWISFNSLMLDRERSFCHGDLTLSNLLVNRNDIYVIDPNYQENLYSSWLLDLAKLLQSSRGYEFMFRYTDVNRLPELTYLRDAIQEYVGPAYMQVCKLLELSHWLRLLKYKRTIDTHSFQFARQITIGLSRELEELWQTQPSY